MPSNQQLEAATYMKLTFSLSITNPNEFNSLPRISMHRSDFPTLKYFCLSLFISKENNSLILLVIV
ncbi:hypothetical protein PMEGAS67_40260 [Priestia megaterium]